MLRNREEKIESLKEEAAEERRELSQMLRNREEKITSLKRQLRVQERKMRHLHSVLRDRGFEVEDSEELEAASAGQPSTSEASLPLSLLATRSRGRGPVRSDEPPQAAGRDEPPQAAGRDEPPQAAGRDEPPQAAGRDEPPQAAGRDNLKLAAAKDHSSGAA
ncbi:eukaryotic translation initiation factor 3 subunit A-like isoform X3 [Penaeus japonicus]|uniref:eukaryotic translation initiation factor 3 subunit A-like isoform X3 n=1 Tax=Penaeus japonicus TaxID=27405 RepID=UPI001C713313|nr:eukaryotic translation initiation factor 3 subunit A-like isoform X3 [Penaeus japonicus]